MIQLETGEIGRAGASKQASSSGKQINIKGKDHLRPTGLIGSVRPSQLLNSLVRTPGKLQGDVNPATLVGNSLVGLKRNSGGSSLREDGNELLPVLEMSAFFDIDHIETALALATLILDDLLASYPIGFLDLALQMQKKQGR